MISGPNPVVLSLSSRAVFPRGTLLCLGGSDLRTGLMLPPDLANASLYLLLDVFLSTEDHVPSATARYFRRSMQAARSRGRRRHLHREPEQLRGA